MALQGIKLRVPRVMAISPKLHTMTPGSQAKLRRMVREIMSKPGGKIQSRNGMSAALAMTWCEERGEPYTLKAIPGAGYSIQREDTPS